ncbi:MAG: four helix bundle protein [bacterium]
MSKRDKFGIYLKVENICIDLIIISIDAALNQKDRKKSLLHELRIKIETLKQLIRAMSELKIIEDKPYIFLETQLQEISKMATGWIKYLEI